MNLKAWYIALACFGHLWPISSLGCPGYFPQMSSPHPGCYRHCTTVLRKDKRSNPHTCQSVCAGYRTFLALPVTRTSLLVAKALLLVAASIFLDIYLLRKAARMKVWTLYQSFLDDVQGCRPLVLKSCIHPIHPIKCVDKSTSLQNAERKWALLVQQQALKQGFPASRCHRKSKSMFGVKWCQRYGTRLSKLMLMATWNTGKHRRFENCAAYSFGN